jgi:hypothetical protein
MFDILRTGLMGMIYTLIAGSYFLLLLAYALGMMFIGFVGHLHWALKRPKTPARTEGATVG